jgi:hypothetical protein
MILQVAFGTSLLASIATVLLIEFPNREIESGSLGYLQGWEWAIIYYVVALILISLTIIGRRDKLVVKKG